MLALTIALVGPYFIDWTSYRADFEREASRILGRDVKVEGAATARLLPFPSVTFTDVTVAGVEPGETAMTIETFSMDAELAPFLSGEVLIFDMRLVRPSAVVDVGENGTLDWAMRPSVPVDIQNVRLEKLTVTEGKITVRHAASGRTHLVTELNADISARALTGPWRMEGSLRLDGMKSAVSISTGELDEDGGMRLRLRAAPERYPVTLETDGNGRIEDGRAHYAGDFRLNAATEGDRLRASGGETFAIVEASSEPADEDVPPAYRLSGRFDFDHETLKVEEFRFETGPVEDPYTADGSAEFDLGAEPRFLIRADGAQIRLADTQGEAKGSFSLGERMAAFRDFALDMPKPAIPGRVEVKLPAIVAGDTTVRNVHLLAEPSEAGWTVASLGATLPGRTTLEAKGELATGEKLGFTGSLLLAVGQPSGFAAWLSKDIDDAIRRLPAAGFSAEVDLTEERQTFRNLELVLGAAKFRGEIDRTSPAETRPTMALRIDGDSLDVEGMAAFASLFVSEQGVTRLADHDLDFDIKAGPVSVAGLKAETLDTALRLRDGHLEIDRLSIGGLAGANISATGTIKDFDGNPTGNLDATIIAPDLAPLVSTLAERYPDSRLAAGLARRANAYPGLLENASVDVVASAAAHGDGTSGLALSANGEAGGTGFSLTGSAADASAAPTQTPMVLNFTATNDEAAGLYALFGLPALPIGFAGAAETEIEMRGVIEDGAETTLSFSGDGFDFDFDGIVGLGVEGASAQGFMKLVSDDLEPWLVTAGVGLPGAGLGLPASLETEIDFGDDMLVLSGIDGSVAGSRISGDLNAEMKDGLPHLTGAVALQTFDLARVAEMVVGAKALAGHGSDWPTAPFQPDVSTPATADIELRADTLLAGSFARSTDARLALKLDRDGMAISRFSANIHGGVLTGLIDLKNDGGTGLLSGQLQLKDARIESLLGDIGVAGEADLTASVTASGKSIEGIVTALAGSGTASVRDFGVQGVDPDALAAILAKADAHGPEIDAAATAVFAPDLIRNGEFRADTVELAFTVVNGVVRAPPLRLETEGAVLTADLRADLGEATIGSEATLTYDPGIDALVGSEPTVRLVAAGPLDDIGVLVDTDPLAQFLTQRALEREQQRVEAMQASLLEKQRYRREVRYYAALKEERVRAAEAARQAGEEAARLERERKRQAEEEARRAAEEASSAAEAAARAAAEERRQAEERERLRRDEEAERRRAEEQARLQAEEAERAREAEQARAAEQERLREENERLRSEVEALLKARQAEPDADAILREPLAPPESLDVAPAPAPRREPDRSEAANGLPGVSDVFTERNLSIDGLMRAIGESR